MSFVNADTTSPADPECHVAADEPARAVAVRGEVAVDLAMRHAGMQPLVLRYELQGHDGTPVVFVAGGISASRHVASSAEFPDSGWAEALLGPGRTLSPGRFRVLSFDFVGRARLRDPGFGDRDDSVCRGRWRGDGRRGGRAESRGKRRTGRQQHGGCQRETREGQAHGRIMPAREAWLRRFVAGEPE